MSTAIKLFRASAFVALRMSAQFCSPPGDQQARQIEKFVKAWYKLPPNQTVTLADSGEVEPGCYRKLVFRASAPLPSLVLYLTPDKNHLVSGIMDLTVDPAITQDNMRKELAAKLAYGAQLVSTDNNAITTIVVFSDFECPYCKTFAEISHQLTPEERARVKFIYRQLPLKHSRLGGRRRATDLLRCTTRSTFILEVT